MDKASIILLSVRWACALLMMLVLFIHQDDFNIRVLIQVGGVP